jgi:hypothetical protein
VNRQQNMRSYFQCRAVWQLSWTCSAAQYSMSPMGSSHWLCRSWYPCFHPNHLHHFPYSLSTSYTLHHSTHSHQSHWWCGSHMAHRDSTWRARHNDLGMHVQASDGRDNVPTSCVLLNLCMVYMLKGIEESAGQLTLCKMAGVRVNWVPSLRRAYL